MKNILLLFGLLLVFKSESQTIKKTYYDEFLKTKLKEEFQVNENGLKNGWYKQYATDGITVKVKATFLNGQLNGLSQSYMIVLGRVYPHETIMYKNGLMDGTYKACALNNISTVIKQGSYKDGKRVGTWTFSIRTSEDIESTISYAFNTSNCVNDECSEIDKWYYSNKQLYRETIKFSNYTKETNYYPNGKLYSEIYYCKVCRQTNRNIDSLIEYYNSGKVKLKHIEYLIPDKNGELQDNNGNTYSKVYLKYEYRENGTIIKGEKTGVYEEYDVNGNKSQDMIGYEENQKKVNEQEKINKEYLDESNRLKKEFEERTKNKERNRHRIDSIVKIIETFVVKGNYALQDNELEKSKSFFSESLKMIEDTNNIKIGTLSFDRHDVGGSLGKEPYTVEWVVPSVDSQYFEKRRSYIKGRLYDVNRMIK